MTVVPVRKLRLEISSNWIKEYSESAVWGGFLSVPVSTGPLCD